jgi:hypothetical protein
MINRKPRRDPNVRRLRGRTLVRYGGLVTWVGRGDKWMQKGVEVWGPPEWDPTFYGSGEEIMDAIEAKAQKRWPKARCSECWRV